MTLTTDTPELQDLVSGEVLRPADPGYGEALAGFNAGLPHHPDVVVRARSAQDVAATVGYAGTHGLKIAVESTGHGSYATGRGTILVRTSDLTDLVVDPGARTATVGAGVVWQQVLDAAEPVGLGGLCGSSPGAGVVGYTLGGGVSPIGRAFGFSADLVRSIDVVTADGRLQTVGPGDELFTALRGGGAAFGLVTGMTIDLPPVPSLYAGGIFTAAGDEAETRRLVTAWRDWADTLPETAASSVARLNVPDLPGAPEPLRGRSLVHLRFAFVGDPAEGERLIAPMRALAPAILDIVAPLPVSGFAAIHVDPTDPAPFYDAGSLMTGLPDAAIEAFAQVNGPTANLPVALAEIRQLGGAFARQPAAPNVVAGRDAPYLLNVVGMTVPPVAEIVPAACEAVLEALAPWCSGSAMANFSGMDRERASVKIRAGFGPDAARLDALRARLDPTGVLDPAARWSRPEVPAPR